MADKDFPHASFVEGLRFTAQVAAPNLIEGLLRRRRTAVSIAEKIGVEELAFSFLSDLRRTYGNGPVWIRVLADEALLVFGRDAVRQPLEGSPDPFAADPEPKRSAMEHFQPEALTISRNPEWEDRRRFTEAVLDSGQPFHRLGNRFAAVAAEEAAELPSELEWETWNRAVRRVARRIVLGEQAADDGELSVMLGELMDKCNPPLPGDAGLYERFAAKLGHYVQAAEPGSLVGLIAEAPVTEVTTPERQVTHWLFALGDTLAINALRCLALLAVYDDERTRALEDPGRLDGCLQEAMRLWPTAPMLARVTVRDTDWDGVAVPAGTQVLIVNTFNHRDDDAIDDADSFAPDRWITGTAREDWLFNHFSHGPQGCPGANLALLVGKAMLAALLRDREISLLEPALDPTLPLPHALDFFSLRLELSPRSGEPNGSSAAE